MGVYFSLRCGTQASEMWPPTADSGDQTARVPELGAPPAAAGRIACSFEAGGVTPHAPGVGRAVSRNDRPSPCRVTSRPLWSLLRQGFCTGAASVVLPRGREAQPM